jgi:predicted O-methyltransferase YrrM
MNNPNDIFPVLISDYLDLGFTVVPLPACSPAEASSPILKLQEISTGYGMPTSDMNVFSVISDRFDKPKIFAIGNAFGLSTLYLGLLFPGSSIDCIDDHSEGNDGKRGTEITNAIAQKHNIDLKITVGRSPEDTKKAMRHRNYDLIFIDGNHTNEQMIADFNSLEGSLSENCACFFHDVRLSSMQNGFANLKETYQEKYQYIDEIEMSGTGMAVIYRGLDLSPLH